MTLITNERGAVRPTLTRLHLTMARIPTALVFLIGVVLPIMVVLVVFWQGLF